MKYLFLLLLTLFLAGLTGQQTCYTPTQIQPMLASLDPDPLDGNYCVTVYVEVDHDIVQDKGERGSRVYMEGLLSEVAALYQEQDITLSFIVKYWDTPSPYSSTSSGELLTQFRTYVSENGGHDGDVGMLVSYQASGGIAYVDVICRANFGYGFASIEPTYEEYPVFSWSVEVISHELGHNLGSNHTHACVWNGDNTAIDGLSPFGVEGSCPRPDQTESGTIMSYGHLSNFGIDFRKGFHAQPLAIIKNRIANATCTECVDTPDDPEHEACDGNQIIVEVQLDNYPFETSWRIMDGEDIVAYSRPFTKSQMNSYQADTVCLPDGCYSFEIMDVDGIAGFGCSEGLYIVNGPNGELASGQDFSGEEITRFCFGQVDEGCNKPVLNATFFSSYANQDITNDSYNEGDAIVFNGNTWQATPYDYIVTSSTVLTGEIFVETLGEIHAIGLTQHTESLAPSLSFRLAGTQGWGRAFADVEVGKWVDFEIPIGQHIPRVAYRYLMFINDHDPNEPVKTKWRNIDLCETGSSPLLKNEIPVEGVGDEVVVEDIILKPHPNPVTDTLTLPDYGVWFLYTEQGTMIKTALSGKIDFSFLPPGLYFVWAGGNIHKIIKQ